MYTIKIHVNTKIKLHNINKTLISLFNFFFGFQLSEEFKFIFALYVHVKKTLKILLII